MTGSDLQPNKAGGSSRRACSQCGRVRWHTGSRPYQACDDCASDEKAATTKVAYGKRKDGAGWDVLVITNGRWESYGPFKRRKDAESAIMTSAWSDHPKSGAALSAALAASPSSAEQTATSNPGTNQ